MNKTNLTHQQSVTLTFTRVISLYEVNLGSIGVTHCLHSVTLQTSRDSAMQSKSLFSLLPNTIAIHKQ